MTERLVRRWSAAVRRLDPELDAFRKAVKTAVVVTVALAIGTVGTDNPAFTIFAAFGAAAMLLFADFPGTRTARLVAYLGLAVAGLALVVLGTIASAAAWLAVIATAVVGVAVWFSGVFSAAAAGATRAAMLAFVLAVTVPGPVSDVPARAAGWGLAALLAIPVAVWIWPPRDHDLLRQRASTLCGVIAERLRGAADGSTVRAASAALRAQAHSTTARPVGLTTGSRLLLVLTDRLEWLAAVTRPLEQDSPHTAPDVRRLVERCADVLEACEAVVLGPRSAEPRARLDTALQALHRQRVAASLFRHVIEDEGDDADRDQQRAVVHEIVWTTRLVADTVAGAAAADARTVVDRVLGRGTEAAGELVSARRIASGQTTWRSVWFQNSLRAGLGLALAVGLARAAEVQHGFWVVLGAMSVLRTTAVTTGSTAARAMVGTAIGFAAGAAVLAVLGTTPWHLWLVLPAAVFVAAYLPEVVSFVAGQAAFTLWVVLQFNLIAPAGWTVGLVRLEDVALGCAAGLVAGALVWPRGASARIRVDLADAFAAGGAAFSAAGASIDALGSAEGARTALASARAADMRLDDALRQYLSERGSKPLDLEELTTATNGTNRLRLSAQTLADFERKLPPLPAGETSPEVLVSSGVDPAVDILTTAVNRAAEWYDGLAESIRHPEQDLPVPDVAGTESRVAAVLRRARLVPGTADYALGRRLWVASLYVDDATRLEGRLRRPVGALVERSGSRTSRT